MLLKTHIKHAGLIALTLMSFSALVSAQITPRERFKLVPYLIPEDPGNLLLEALPKIKRYPLTEVDSIFLSKKENPLVVNQSWQTLAINYLLHGQYERSLECLDEVDLEVIENPLDIKIVQAYAHTKLHNWAESEKEWNALGVLLDSSYLPQLNLFANAIQQYKLEESTKILEETLAGRDKIDPLLHHYIGIRHFQEGNLQQARISFIKAITPVKPNPYALLAMSLLSLTESASFDSVGWLQRSIENATIPVQRSIIEIPAFAKIESHPDYRRVYESIKNSSYKPPDPALEEDLSFRYDEKFSLSQLLDGGIKLRIFEPKDDVWKMK